MIHLRIRSAEATFRPRQQPELATPEMASWQSYLRGQADALGLPVLDTSELSIEESANALHGQISALAAV